MRTLASLSLSVVLATQALSAQAPDSVVFAGLDMSTISGTRVGAHREGLAKVVQHSIVVRPAQVQAWQQRMLTGAPGVISNAGIPVRSRSTLFGEDTAGARFVLAARLDDLRYDTYGMFAGNAIRATMVTTWELLDRSTRRVVFSKQTRADGQVARRNETSLMDQLLHTLLQPVLTDSVFRSALLSKPAVQARQTVTEQGIAPAGGRWQRPFPRETEVVSIRSDDRNLSRSTDGPVARAVAGVVSLAGRSGHGTAFLITRDGLALTNHHVIEGERDLVARDNAGRTHRVRVLRSDAEADVALVELECVLGCTTVSLAARLPTVGADVYLIGTPVSQALDHTVTRGIISGVRRAGPVTMLQTDAAVNPGNSGGPMINAAGEVLGIVTSKLVGRDLEGLGFAVSISDALRVMGVQQ